MEGIFKPESKTIEELFGDKSSYYKMSVYFKDRKDYPFKGI